MSHPDLIKTDAALAELLIRLRDADEIAVDCEFHSEKRYFPDLFLVQLGDSHGASAVDPRSVDLAPLGPLLANTAIRKIVHAGHQDARLLSRATGHDPANVFDTQVAAAFLGHGPSVGFARLAEATVGAKVDKSSQYSRWDGPLTDKQVSYALDDVRILLRASAVVRQQLEDAGRTAWAEDESQTQLTRSLTNTPPDRLWRKIRGANRLGTKDLGILRELAIWRDAVAQALNKPLNAVANDAALKQLACRPPTAQSDLRGKRGVGAGASGRWWDALESAIQKGRQRPEPKPKGQRTDKAVEGALQILSSIRRKNAEDHNIAPNLLASESTMRELVSWANDGRPATETPVLMSGWRAELLGDELLKFIDGKLAIRVDLSSPTGTRLIEM